MSGGTRGITRGIVTVSAAYGAWGSHVGPAVADALGLPFVDRAIPRAVAHSLGVPLAEAEAQDDRGSRGLWRVLTSMAMVPDLAGGQIHYETVGDERVFAERTEQVLRQVADGPGAVILGRAGAVVLRDRPDALHVRLTGPRDARVASVAREDGLDEQAAAELVDENDRAREAYVRTYYRCDAKDPRLYHLVVDTTALPWAAVTDLVVRAARARGIGG